MKKLTVLLIATWLIWSAPVTVWAQSGQSVRIGFLSYAPMEQLYQKTFVEELDRFGWIEGKNITTEWRSLDGDEKRLSAVLSELFGLDLHVLVTISTPITLAAKKANTKTPIVFWGVSDPLGSKIVPSLSQPGGNVTGVSQMDTVLCGKRVQLLTEVMPDLKRLGVLLNPTASYVPTMLARTQQAAATANLEVSLFEAKSLEGLDSAFKAMDREDVEAFVQIPHIMYWTHRKRIVNLAARYRLPGLYETTEFVDEGGLMAYAENLPEHLRRAAAYVDQILRGKDPADLPVSQPMEFELAINLRTAQDLNLNIPESVLVLADQIIE
ncbi:MAG: ABC transporter substrate-binding protein [Desulfobacterales bacterium]